MAVQKLSYKSYTILDQGVIRVREKCSKAMTTMLHLPHKIPSHS